MDPASWTSLPPGRPGMSYEYDAAHLAACEAADQCERSALCTRGFRHRGKGGHCNQKRKEADPVSSEVAAVGGTTTGGKRHLSDLGGRGLLEIGMYVTEDLETQKVSEGATIWEGLVVNVPATVFQEEDPDGYYMGNVRDAPCLVQASLACANAPCLCLACGR